MTIAILQQLLLLSIPFPFVYRYRHYCQPFVVSESKTVTPFHVVPFLTFSTCRCHTVFPELHNRNLQNTMQIII